MKQQSLKSKWMLITTFITFLIVFIFSLVMIYFLSNTLKNNELDEAERSADSIYNLLETKPVTELTSLDLNAALVDFQKIILYDKEGHRLLESSNNLNTHLDFKLKLSRSHHVSYQNIKGVDYFVVTNPVNTNQFNGYSVVIHSLKSYNAILESIIYIAIMFALAAITITAMISYIFSSQLTKPLYLMANKMTQIRRDGFQEKLELPTNYEETDNLIDTFNDMMETIETSFNQQRQFVEDASHELRTPLQIIQGHLNLIQRWGKKDPAVLEESLDISVEELNRIIKLVEELLLLSKETDAPNTSEHNCVEINQEITQRIKSLQQIHPDYTFEFTSTNRQIELDMNRYHLEQILLIFIDNAIKYDTVNKHIQIETSLRNKQVAIEITDYGIGIPKEDARYIFDRFYRVDKSRSRKQGGNGLGLSIAKKLVDSYDGHIQIDSEPGKYTTFKMTFNA